MDIHGTSRQRRESEREKKHPTRLERYTQLTSASLKRKSSTEGSLAPHSKQTKLWETQRVSQRFTPVELAFLGEYVKTMSPVAKTLDVLQGETSVQMGWMVPTITLLRTKRQQLNIASKFCEPFIAALLSGLEKRFGEMLTDPELIVAAILVPKFKTCWTSDENILKLGLDYIRSHLDCHPENHISEGSQSSEEEDFFSSLKKTSPLETTQQLDAYLGCLRDTVEVQCSMSTDCMSLDNGRKPTQTQGEHANSKQRTPVTRPGNRTQALLALRRQRYPPCHPRCPCPGCILPSVR